MRLRNFFWLLLLLVSSTAWPHGQVNDYEEDVEAMYVAYYGRPADPDGVTYWSERLEAENGDLNEIIDAFGNSDEYRDRFGELDNTALVNNVFQQLFGRDADEAGLAFYTGQLDAGEASLASIALDVYNGALGTDRLTVVNKITIAHAFTDAIEDLSLGYNDAEIAEGMSLLAAIDQSRDSVVDADNRLAAYFSLSDETDCSGFESSFDRIQSIIFEGYNCTNSACHSSANPGGPSGQLDLTAGNAYEALFRVEAAASLAEPQQLVYPGEQAFSFLYHKLAAATLGTELIAGGGTPMPVGSEPLSEEHLEALRLWIRGGAPETGDVDEVATLLGCRLPTRPQANKIAPPEPPAAGEGVQFVSGPWTVEANSENEVCYATYYDLDQVPGALPDEARTACEGGIFQDYDGDCFAINSQILTQDAQSHHSIIDVYVGATPVDDPSWGEWQCLNGPSAGTPCDPTQIGVPVAQGGADCGGERYVCGTPAKRAIACTGWGADDQAFRGISMGGSQTPISETIYYEGVYNLLPTRGVIIWNSHGFNLTDESTTIEQYNNLRFAGQDEREHRARAIFDVRNIFVADVPPFQERTYCSTYRLPRGTRLTDLGSHAHERGVLWQTWLPPNEPCSIDDCEPNDRPAEYVSRIYNDPLVLPFDPPLEYDSTNNDERTLKSCVTYANGTEEYPDLLKRNSTSVGSTCYGAAYCVGGDNQGAFCGDDDSVCGDGGSCDACPVVGGFTTEDEMFLPLGTFYKIDP